MSHQRAFIELHEAIKKEEAYKYLVEEVEQLSGAPTRAATAAVSAIQTGKIGN
jgi:hypothetical protein